MDGHEDPMRLLIVDDTPEIVAVMVAMISRMGALGVQVEHTTSARDALERARTWPYEMVLADYRMPEHNGDEILREAYRLHPEGSRVLMTGYLDLEFTPQERRAMGLTALLRKPISREILVGELQRAVRAASFGAPRRGDPPTAPA